MADLDSLYAAQQKAIDARTTWVFPRYAEDYIKNSYGLFLYQRGVDAFDWVYNGASSAIALLGRVLGCFCSGGWVLNWVYPVNHINGKRSLQWVPRKVENFLGKYLFYPLNTWGMIQEVGSKKDLVNAIFNQLSTNNEALLNPQGVYPFEYCIHTIKSDAVNAFAVPGGRMVVFSGMLSQIENFIERLQNEPQRTIEVDFPDGSIVSIPVEEVTKEDLIAALIGHEITHAAARHAIVGLIASSLLGFVLRVASVAISTIFASNALFSAKKNKTQEDRESYILLRYILNRLADQFSNQGSLWNSRENEFEADVTGLYMAQKAGYNPLGALVLQKLLLEQQMPVSTFLHETFEMRFTHPSGKRRLQSLVGALGGLGALPKNTTKRAPAKEIYAPQKSSPSIQFISNFQSTQD